MAFAFFAGVDDGAGEVFAAFAAVCPYFAEGDFRTVLAGGFCDEGELGMNVDCEGVDWDDDR